MPQSTLPEDVKVFLSTNEIAFPRVNEDALRAAGYREPGRFHHSSLVAGEPVAGAGTVMALNGQTLRITDNSGHYLPKQRHTLQVVDYLRSLGLRVDDCQIVMKAVD